MHKLLLILSFLIFVKISYSQLESKLKVAVSGGAILGTYIAKTKNFDKKLPNENGSLWHSSLGFHLGLGSSVKVRWKNSFDLSFGAGGYLNTYSFASRSYQGDGDGDSPDDSDSITGGSVHDHYTNYMYEMRFSKYISFYPEANVYGSKEFSDTRDFLSLGCGFGFSPYKYMSHYKENLKGSIMTQTNPVYPFYISPHIGIYTKDNRVGVTLLVQYTHYLAKNPYIQFDLQNVNYHASGSHRGDYLGLNFIVDYDLRIIHKSIKDKFPLEKPADADVRDSITEQTLDVRRKKIKIYVWDHGMIDNDTISLLMNGQPILYDYGLVYKKKKIKVRLPDYESYLTLYAHNEGSVKPNSAAVIIQTGWFRKRNFILNSTMETSEVLKIVYK